MRRRRPPRAAASTILVVEDDAALQQIVYEMLRAAGHRPACVNNGREALEYLLGGGARPAVILLDLQMPVMNGENFRTEQLRLRAFESIPVIILSAHPDVASEARRLNLPYLTKPFDRESLLEAVSRYARDD